MEVKKCHLEKEDTLGVLRKRDREAGTRVKAGGLVQRRIGTLAMPEDIPG